MPSSITIDFETFAIMPRPQYPPVPVGVSIKYPGKRAHYYAWGHPCENNCTKEEAYAALARVWDSDASVICHNAKFDLDVAEEHFGLPMLPWQRIHDTMLLLFLDNPHADKLALKPSAERLLGMKPEEQDAVRDWLVQHQPVAPVRITQKNFGAYIAHAPGKLVGKYADGDVIRTEMLFKVLAPQIKKRGMQRAYDRERKLIPILIDMERQGIRVHVQRLENDLALFDKTLARIDAWLHRKLKDKEVNLDSGQQLVLALAQADLLDLNMLGTTPASTPDRVIYKSDKDSLNNAILDDAVSGTLQYRAQLLTCVNTFMRPWHETALLSGGWIYTQWNQIRSGESGARTGRFSSSPNFQNIPKEFKPIFREDIPFQVICKSTPEELAERQRQSNAYRTLLPKMPFTDLPALPQVRSYVIPYDKGDVLLDRDYSQQELRILAHFEDGVLRDAYLKDNWLDVHEYARTLINGMLGTNYSRKVVKTIVFGLIYGMGVGKLAAGANITFEQAREVKTALLRVFPGLHDMNHEMRNRAALDVPIATWGARKYHCEPSKYIDGETRSYEYKMLNVLIQGSAADCTKEALIKYYETKEPEVKLLLSVHDEILISVPKAMIAGAMNTLRAAMESLKFDVPMLSEGTISETNWAQMRSFDEKGVLA